MPGSERRGAMTVLLAAFGLLLLLLLLWFFGMFAGDEVDVTDQPAAEQAQGTAEEGEGD
jgi:hypothetical protein